MAMRCYNVVDIVACGAAVDVGLLEISSFCCVVCNILRLGEAKVGASCGFVGLLLLTEVVFLPSFFSAHLCLRNHLFLHL